tara:strand:- start:1776 stop:2897 length:1122 start_codon:yes stop_codon:yes gene_type:complete
MIVSLLKTLNSILIINILIIFYKLKKKKIIFFYHPRKLLTFIHKYYIEDLLNKLNPDYSIIYGHKVDKNLGKNYFFIKESYLKFILRVNFFISNNVCDKFVRCSKKIYMYHNIYDSPLVSVDKEKEVCKRLSKYDLIFLPSQKSANLVKQTFDKFDNGSKIKIPNLMEVGYPKLDYLEKKFNLTNNNKKNSVLIAPTNFHGFPNLSLIDDLEKIIGVLLNKTEVDVIFRPHPSNRQDHKILEIKKKFLKNSRFYYDQSENYFGTYSKSICLITDLSATAYTFAFLTLCPIIFYSPNEEKIKSLKYDSLSYFIDRNKIGIIVENIDSISDKVNNLKSDVNKYKNYKKAILEIRNEIKFFGKSFEKFKMEIDKLT